MSGDRARARARGRRGERGATLTIFAFATGTILVVVGASLMDALTNTYRMSALRERQAQARGLAEAGLASALAHIAEDPVARSPGGHAELSTGTYEYQVSPVGDGGVRECRAEGTVGAGVDRVHVKLKAVLAPDAATGRLRLISVARE